LGFQVANDLVNQKLLIKLAKEKNVYPTDAEVDAEIKFRNTKRKDFVISQTQQGFTLDQIKNDIIIDLCQYKLVTKGVTVTDAEVNDFITKNPKNFREPKLVDILVIVAKDPKTIALVDSDLKSGQSFEAVAKRFSLDRNIQIPERVYDNLAPKLKQIVDKFPKGGVSGWLPDNGFKIKFNIVKVTPPRDVKIEPYMKEDIRRLIAANKGSKTVNLQKMLSDKRTQAKVIVNKQTLKLPFEALDKELQKQAKDAKQKK
jgi:foldase protein PrsA